MEIGQAITIFGREPTLSAWELFRLTRATTVPVLTRELAVLPLPAELTAAQLQRRSGGLVKVGIVRGDVVDLSELEHILAKQWPGLIPAGSTARIAFGGSAYDAGVVPSRTFRRDLGSMLQRIKREMMETGRAARIVVSKEPTLSAAALTQGKILERGFELLVLCQLDGLTWGTTATMQDISAYGDRDVGRPARDTLSGMLPPKVAQVMVNLGQVSKGEKLLDPFCGSGTILQEAALLGVQHLQASDISAKAVADTEENFAWLTQHLPETRATEFEVRELDANQLEKIFGRSAFDVVVTEPYLGPPQRGTPQGRVLLPLVSALSRQYTTWLQSIAKVLKPNGRAIMVWPFYRVEPNGYFLQLQKAAHDAGFLVVAPPKQLLDATWFRSTPRGSVLYSRPDQIVGREIIVLQKRA
ncbi:MAG: methyltransferase domain-containing protein [bacterium]|nr:methyltransferase domain-containing protein [bacterium]